MRKGMAVSIGSYKQMKEDGLHMHHFLVCHESLGLTIVYFAVDRQVVALFIIGDRLRSDSQQQVLELQALGYNVAISGDNWQTTPAIAELIGVREFY